MCIRKEVETFIQDYYQSFQPGNLDAVVNHYHDNTQIVVANMVIPLNGSEAVSSALQAGLDNLAEQNFGYSRFQHLDIFPLNKQQAFVTTAFTRYKQDGSELEKLGATYTLIKTDDGWKIAQVVMHGADEYLQLV